MILVLISKIVKAFINYLVVSIDAEKLISRESMDSFSRKWEINFKKFQKEVDSIKQSLK
jgi:hypothetical protein